MSPDRMHEHAWFPREDFKVIAMSRTEQPGMFQSRQEAFWKIFLIFCGGTVVLTAVYLVSSWLWEVL